MATDPHFQRLTTLRHRFLMEPQEKINEWLKGEHPQIAVFILNWMGSLERLEIYLKEGSTAQRADLLFRLAQMDPDDPPSPFQEEVMEEALRQVSPYLREAKPAMDEDDRPPLRGLALAAAWLSRLEKEPLEAHLAQLGELDPMLARIGQGFIIKRAKPAPTLFGLANHYCDLMAHHLSVVGLPSGVVFLDQIETLSAGSAKQELDDEWITFRGQDTEGGQAFYLAGSTRLFYHYLESSFNAARPLMHHQTLRSRVTYLEREVAATFSQRLSGYLYLALFGEARPLGAAITPNQPNETLEELETLGATPITALRMSVRLGSTRAGHITWLLPPAFMGLLRHHYGEEVMAGLTAAPPSTLPAEKLLPEDGSVLGLEETGHEKMEENLESYLWQSELEAAAAAAEIPDEPETGPLDLLLAGYKMAQISQELPEEEEDREWLADVHHFYGSRFLQKKLYHDAVKALSLSLEISGHNEFTQLLLAAALGETGQYMKELLSYRELIAKSKCLPEAQVLLARRLSYLKKEDQSLQAIKDAAENGFKHLEIVEADPCFKALRQSGGWRAFLASQEK